MIIYTQSIRDADLSCQNLSYCCIVHATGASVHEALENLKFKYPKVTHVFNLKIQSKTIIGDGYTRYI